MDQPHSLPRPTVKKEFFSDSPYGPVTAYVLDSGVMSVTVLDLGGIIQKWIYDGKDIVCGFDDAASYLRSGTYYGAVIGRCCGRMHELRINGGDPCPIALNENGKTHLHGGNRGFDKQFWTVTPFEAEDFCALRLERFFRDGEEGYPGNLTVIVEYLLRRSSLSFSCHAVADRNTAVNMTNHSYFNLNGPGGDILSHRLYIPAWFVSDCDEDHVPTGNRIPIWGGPLDFNKPKEIGQDLHSEIPLMTAWKGYDHNYHLRKCGGLTLAARAEGDDTVLEVLTDLPCVQLYTGNYPEDGNMKYGLPQTPYRAFCLETQMEPNFAATEGIFLPAGEHYQCTTVYRLGKKQEETQWEPGGLKE